MSIITETLESRLNPDQIIIIDALLRFERESRPETRFIMENSNYFMYNESEKTLMLSAIAVDCLTQKQNQVVLYLTSNQNKVNDIFNSIQSAIDYVWTGEYISQLEDCRLDINTNYLLVRSIYDHFTTRPTYVLMDNIRSIPIDTFIQTKRYESRAKILIKL